MKPSHKKCTPHRYAWRLYCVNEADLWLSSSLMCWWQILSTDVRYSCWADIWYPIWFQPIPISDIYKKDHASQYWDTKTLMRNIPILPEGFLTFACKSCGFSLAHSQYTSLNQNRKNKHKNKNNKKRPIFLLCISPLRERPNKTMLACLHENSLSNRGSDRIRLVFAHLLLETCYLLKWHYFPVIHTPIEVECGFSEGW